MCGTKPCVVSMRVVIVGANELFCVHLFACAFTESSGEQRRQESTINVF